MPMLPGETLAEFDARLKARGARNEPEPITHISQIPAPERDAYVAALTKRLDRQHVAPPPPVHLGLRWAEMSPNQRMEAAQAWGVAHVLDRSAYTTNPEEF